MAASNKAATQSLNFVVFNWMTSLQTHHVYSTLKRRGNDRFHVISTWNTRGVFVGSIKETRKSKKRLSMQTIFLIRKVMKTR